MVIKEKMMKQLALMRCSLMEEKAHGGIITEEVQAGFLVSIKNTTPKRERERGREITAEQKR